MYLECARIYIAGASLAGVRRMFPNARQIAGRVYVGYDNASGAVFRTADRLASELGGWVESEAD